jgi:hypothetical protein
MSIPTPILDPLLEEMTPQTTQATSTNQSASATPTPSEKKTKNNTKTDNPKKKNPNWTIEEDKHLCFAWLNTTRNSIVGTGQKATTFWDRVHQYYTELIDALNEAKKNVKNFKFLPPQITNAVECRWGHIMKTCNKFGGCYSQVERCLKSGRTRDDIVRFCSLFQSVIFE